VENVWVPIAAALISAGAILAGVWASRRNVREERGDERLELIITGAFQLIEEIQEDREHLRRLLTECLESKGG